MNITNLRAVTDECLFDDDYNVIAIFPVYTDENTRYLILPSTEDYEKLKDNGPLDRCLILAENICYMLSDTEFEIVSSKKSLRFN